MNIYDLDPEVRKFLKADTSVLSVKLSDDSLAEAYHRIELGMKALDEYFKDIPWWDRIDLDSFDLSLGSVCVCGQLFEQNANDLAGASDGFDWALQNVMETLWLHTDNKLEGHDRRTEYAEKLGFLAENLDLIWDCRFGDIYFQVSYSSARDEGEFLGLSLEHEAMLREFKLDPEDFIGTTWDVLEGCWRDAIIRRRRQHAAVG